MTNEIQLLLRSSRTEVSSRDRRTLGELLSGDLSWQRVLDLAAWHGTYTLLYRSLRSAGIRGPDNDEAMRHLGKAYYASAALHHRRRGELQKALTALRAEGIPVIVLKGAALAETVYPDPALRIMDGIDLLVEEDHLKLADERIRGFGYGAAESPYKGPVGRDRRRPYPDLQGESGITRFEIHPHLVPRDSGFHFDISECWQSALPVEIAGVETAMLGPEEMLFHLCAGFFLDRRRFYPSHAALSQLVDVAETIRHYETELDWDRFVDLALRRRLGGPLYCVLTTSRELLDSRVPVEALEKLRPERFDPSMQRAFVERKVLEIAPWFLHELVTVPDNTRWKMLKSAIRRILLPGKYLRTKYWPEVKRSSRLKLRHGIDVLRFIGESARSPGRTVAHLQIDRWMHLLVAPPGKDVDTAHGRQ